jgi:hypothetical protein
MKSYFVDMDRIARLYLEGKTTRQLVKYYPTSPVRINNQIRTYLSKTPIWNDYIDNIIPFRNTKQIYLTGKKFHCSWNSPVSNEMFVAFAICSMTGFVLDYRVASSETHECWTDLLNNLQVRHIRTNSFLTNGSEKSQTALDEVYPNIDKRITYHRNYRDKELGCCLSRLSPQSKLINDAVKIYLSNDNKILAEYLGLTDEKQLHIFLSERREEFTDIVKNRLRNRSKLFNDAFPNQFQKRFEKFHLLREDPVPIINSWIAFRMLATDEHGINNLTLFAQEPFQIKFKHFVKNVIKQPEFTKKNRQFLERLLVEICARCLELPVLINDCSFDSEKCLLVV